MTPPRQIDAHAKPHRNPWAAHVALSLLLAQSGLPVALAQAAGIGTFIVSFYVLNRRFVFRTAPDRR